MASSGGRRALLTLLGAAVAVAAARSWRLRRAVDAELPAPVEWPPPPDGP